MKVEGLSVAPDDFWQQIIQVHQDLGIPDSYRDNCSLPVCIEPADLVDTEPDYYQRPQKLTLSANTAWKSMQRAAGDDGISLFLISAFRSVEYQRTLFEKKLAQGLQLAEIMTVLAMVTVATFGFPILQEGAYNSRC